LEILTPIDKNTTSVESTTKDIFLRKSFIAMANVQFI
jgi:hypothetical protein